MGQSGLLRDLGSEVVDKMISLSLSNKMEVSITKKQLNHLSVGII